MDRREYTFYVSNSNYPFQHCRTANNNPPVTFAVAACENQNVDVTVLPVFGLSGESSITAREMWGTMVQVFFLFFSSHLT